DVGLKNLYKLVSYAHTEYFYREPRVPRSVLEKHREGILVGSACDQGEIFNGMMQKSVEEMEDTALFYDYLEVQPPSTYLHIIDRELVHNDKQNTEVIKKIIKLGERTDKKVVATSNAHYIEAHEKMYGRILIASQKGNPLNRVHLPDTPYRTTRDRKSTRLNSSHVSISYAVFCLKKKIRKHIQK